MTLTQTLVVSAVVPLVLWRLYSRYRKLVSRQKSRPWRHWAAAIFFPAVLLLLASTALAYPYSEAALAAGIASGAALSHFGLRSTRFEATPEGIFFTPNARIGIALMLVLVARVIYRLVEIGGLTFSAGAPPVQDFGRSPLTLAIVGMLLSYYTAYAIGILRWRRARASQGESP